MKIYRFSGGVKHSSYTVLGLSFVLLVTFLFSLQAISVQAAPPRPDGDETLPERAEPTAPAAAAAPQVGISCAGLHEYIPGETLAQIAQRYNITVEELRAANPGLAAHPLGPEYQLCIPAGKVIRDHSKAKVYAYLILGHLTVWGEGFPKYHRYNVRVMADRSEVWYKIGYLDSAKNGTILKYFKLPKDIRYPRKLKVCLKEVDTGWTKCTKAEVVSFGKYP